MFVRHESESVLKGFYIKRGRTLFFKVSEDIVPNESGCIVCTEEKGQIPKLPSKDDKIKKYYLKVLSLKDKGVYPCLDRYLDGRPQDYQDYSCL